MKLRLIFPYLDSCICNLSLDIGRSASSTPTDVFVFIVGGATYEEAMAVKEINASGTMHVVLGGSCMLNSSGFLKGISNINGFGGGFTTERGSGSLGYAKITSV